MAADDDDDDIPPVARPDPAELDFDLDAALSRRSCRSAPRSAPDAFTAQALGTERRGNGVVIGKDGLIVTIGYLITEAERVWLTTVPAAPPPPAMSSPTTRRTGLRPDPALGRLLDAPPLALGSCDALEPGEPLVVAGGRGPRDALSARLVAKRPFAGYWEYYLDTALFTAPAHPHWGGAACIGPDGDLIGIGSLLVQEMAREGQSLVGNMIVPDRPAAADPRRPAALRPGRPAAPALARPVRHRRRRRASWSPAWRQAAPPRAPALPRATSSPRSTARRSRIWATSGASCGPQGRPGVAVKLTLQPRRPQPEASPVQTADRRTFLKRPAAALINTYAMYIFFEHRSIACEMSWSLHLCSA